MFKVLIGLVGFRYCGNSVNGKWEFSSYCILSIDVNRYHIGGLDLGVNHKILQGFGFWGFCWVAGE